MTKLNRIKLKFAEYKNWWRGPNYLDHRWLIERLEECEKALELVTKTGLVGFPDFSYDEAKKINDALKSLKEVG